MDKTLPSFVDLLGPYQGPCGYCAHPDKRHGALSRILVSSSFLELVADPSDAHIEDITSVRYQARRITPEFVRELLEWYRADPEKAKEYVAVVHRPTPESVYHAQNVEDVLD